MHPPSRAFQHEQAGVRQTGIQGMQQRTDGEGPGGVQEAPLLCERIGRIHREQRKHQHRFHYQDDVRIERRPTAQLGRAEPGDGQHIAAHEEHHTRHKDPGG